jgi:hypothetical protein
MMETTKSEFNAFWNEVLGQDGYLDGPSSMTTRWTRVSGTTRRQASS